MGNEQHTGDFECDGITIDRLWNERYPGDGEFDRPKREYCLLL